MKNAIPFVLVSASLAFAPGCALLNRVPGGGNALAAAQKTAGILKDSADAAKAKCDPIRKSEVAWPEERAMGGVTALKRVANSGAKVVLDGMTATDPKALAAQVTASEKDASKKVTLPDSAKNELAAYLAVVGRNLAKYSTRPDISWTFTVIENDTPNAFSAPGGYVFLTTGLLKNITNEAQLAGVVAHEIAHVTLRHSILRYRESKATQCTVATTGAEAIKRGGQEILSALPAGTADSAKFAESFDNFDLDKSDSAFVKFLMDAVISFIELTGNEKDDEFAADATALELVAFAGYDAAEYEKFLTALGESGGAFSKHPPTSERVTKLKTLREGELAPFATGKAKPDTAKQFAVIKTPGA